MLCLFDINILTKPAPCCKCLHVMFVTANIEIQPGLESKCKFDVFTTESFEPWYCSRDRIN